MEERLIFSYWGGRVSVRSQEYRLDHQGQLFNMINDPGQLKDITANEPEIRDYLLAEVEKWKNEVLPGLDIEKRPFTVGHPDVIHTQLPARDGQERGNIVRSTGFQTAAFLPAGHQRMTGSPGISKCWLTDILRLRFIIHVPRKM
jgi:hypothetical protein